MERESKIQKKNGKWKIDEIRANSDDTIIWICDDSDFAVWFPPGRDPFESNPANPEKSKRHKRKLKTSAAKGVYEYAVFCYTDNIMAEGDSPPKMIIE